MDDDDGAFRLAVAVDAATLPPDVVVNSGDWNWEDAAASLFWTGNRVVVGRLVVPIPADGIARSEPPPPPTPTTPPLASILLRWLCSLNTRLRVSNSPLSASVRSFACASSCNDSIS